jgi:hypothetical protein
MTEIEQLRQEVAELRKALAERNAPLPGFAVDDPPSPQLNNFELITDLTRYAEGLLEEKHVRKKYRFDETTWTALGSDEKFIEAVELEKIRRVRDGSFKRERAQQHVTKAPDILNDIMSDTKQSAKHRIDSAKTLDSFSGNGPKDAPEQDRIVIRIDMGADTRVKGEPADPANILVVDAVVRPNKPSDDNKVIDSWDAPKQLELNQEEPVPPKRGPGRPPGSKNKLKTEDPLLPSFMITAKKDENGGQPL